MGGALGDEPFEHRALPINERGRGSDLDEGKPRGAQKKGAYEDERDEKEESPVKQPIDEGDAPNRGGAGKKEGPQRGGHGLPADRCLRRMREPRL